MDKQEFLDNLGANIKAIRKKQGITQSELAWRCNKDKQSIERIENAKVNPSVFILSQVAKALDIPLSDLVKGL